jgi:hypothetical protein
MRASRSLQERHLPHGADATLLAAVCRVDRYANLLAELPDDLLTPLEEWSSDPDSSIRIAINDRLDALEKTLAAVQVLWSFMDAYGNHPRLYSTH